MEKHLIEVPARKLAKSNPAGYMHCYIEDTDDERVAVEIQYPLNYSTNAEHLNDFFKEIDRLGFNGSFPSFDPYQWTMKIFVSEK